MELSVILQTKVFLSFILCGMAVGLLFDLFRLFRAQIRAPLALVWAQDILFWALAALLMFLCAVRLFDGMIRGFELLGAGLGAAAYFWTFSRLFMKASGFALTVLKSALTFMIKAALAPIVFIYKLLRRPFIFIGVISQKAARGAGRKLVRKMGFIKRVKLRLKKI